MRLAHLPFVKICCISSHAEAKLAIAAGASALGLVSPMPSGAGMIDNALIADIAATIPPPMATFLLTPLQNAEEIVDQHRLCRTSTIQLVDAVDYAELRKLRNTLPGIRLVQVIHVIDQRSVDEAIAVVHGKRVVDIGLEFIGLIGIEIIAHQATTILAHGLLQKTQGQLGGSHFRYGEVLR